MPKNNRRKPQAIDATRAAFTTFGVGVVKGNPRKCLHCGKSIKHGEAWRADTSAEDPDGYGRYTVIMHSPSCPDQNARKVFQKMLAEGASA